MRTVIFIAFAAVLTACNKAADTVEVPNSFEASSAPRPAAPAAKAYVQEVKDDLVDFHFSWSAEAAAVPELAARFEAQREKELADLKAGAEEERELRNREKHGLTFNGFQRSTAYETAGQSTRLLSLSVEVSAYEGGAHGNFGTGALLWDRQAGREIKFIDLFAQPANRDRLLTQRWCDALNKAREEKRGEPVGGSGPFEDCPSLDAIAIIPTDKDRNGRFERLMLVASPYVAGPYAEGSYDIELGVTPDLIAAIKREYQPSFEAQGTQ